MDYKFATSLDEIFCVAQKQRNKIQIVEKKSYFVIIYP